MISRWPFFFFRNNSIWLMRHLSQCPTTSWFNTTLKSSSRLWDPQRPREENICVDKTLPELFMWMLSNPHASRACKIFSWNIWWWKNLICRANSCPLLPFWNVFQQMHSVECISGHYSSLWCDKKAISELSQISMGVIMTCKYPEKSWGFKLRDHSHLVNDWHQMKYVLPGCSAILYC